MLGEHTPRKHVPAAWHCDAVTHVTAVQRSMPAQDPSARRTSSSSSPPARGDLPPVTVHWYEGKGKDGKKLQPPKEWIDKALAIDTDQKRKKELVNSGSIIIGEKGYIYSPSDYGAEVFFGPEEAFKGINTKTPEKLGVWEGDFDLNNKKEWVAAIKAGKPEIALSNFDYASYLAGAFVLGNVAIRTGKEFEFDAETLECKGNKDAAQYIKYEYRKGWNMLEDKNA